MPDRYLLESSAVDGYLLEDGSGILLLEEAVGPQTFYFTPTATLSVGGDIGKSGGRGLSAGLGVASLLRQAMRLLRAGVLGVAGAVAKHNERAITATLTMSGAMRMQVQLTLLRGN